MDEKRELDTIREKFEITKSNSLLGELEKTRLYVNMMNELESKFGSFILNPTKEDLMREDVILYRQISDSRYL